MENKFEEFYLDSNLYFGSVKSVENLNMVFKSYEGHMTMDEILDKAYNVGSLDSVPRFTFSVGQIPKNTLRKHLRRYLRTETIDELLNDK